MDVTVGHIILALQCIKGMESGKEGGSRKEGRKDDGYDGMTVTERIGCDQAEGVDCLTFS